MRQFSDAFKSFNAIQTGREPIFVAKIKNDNKNIYLTSREIDIVDLGADILQEVIVQGSTTGQTITPERGFSQIGSSRIKFKDLGFTEILRDLSANFNDTINNNEVELYYGFNGMVFADFALTVPMYVSNISNDELSYTLTLSDTQRFEKKAIFNAKPKTIVNTGIGTSGSEANPVNLEVASTNGFDLVEHDENWSNAPNQTVGYLKFTGVDDQGNDLVEYLRYDQKTATTFRIVERGVFGTRALDIKGSTGSETNEVEECIYLDLPANKMIIALLTNDLLDQPGQKIPSHWGAEIDPNLLNITSFENIGDDIESTPLEFVDMSKEDAKDFIAYQCLSILNLFIFINQFGEFELKRFGSQPQISAGALSVNYENMVGSTPTINRDNRHIRNNFLLSWEYKADAGQYARNDVYIDADSISRNNVTSDAYVVELRGIRNRDRYSGLVINNLARSIRARFSDPAIKFRVQLTIRDGLEIEIGDTVQVEFENQPDFSSEDTLNGAYEVQGATWDYMNGTVSLQLFSTAGRAGALELTEGEDVATIDHSPSDGWVELVTGSLGTVIGDDFFVANGANFSANTRYWFDGDIIFDGSGFVDPQIPAHECFINQSVIFDARDIIQLGNSKINGEGRGVAGGQGGYGGGDTADVRFAQRRKQVLIFSDVWYQVRPRDATDGAGVPASNPALDSLRPIVGTDDKIRGIPSKLYGNGSSQGGRLQTEVTEGNFGNIAGGSAVAGGAGTLFICENYFFDEDCIVDTSGADGQGGGSLSIPGAGTFNAGSSGYGWPGLFLCYIKSRGSALPLLNDVHVGRAGQNGPSGWTVTLPIGDRHYRTVSSGNYGPPSGPSTNGKSFEPLLFLANRDLVQDGVEINKALYIARAADRPPTTGKDTAESAKAVTLEFDVLANTPLTPLGNQTTVEIDAVPDPSDNDFSYVILEYRLLGQDQWVPIDYDVTTSANFTVISDGSTYEVRATSINTVGKAGGVTVDTVVVNFVDRNSEDSEGGSENPDENLTLPDIRGLELVNRIDNDNFDKFKSSNAEFRWLKMSTTAGGDLTQLNGAVDLHLEGYLVRISRPNGEILREELVKDSSYIYTYDKNKKDTDGNPVRNFNFEVQAVSTTGYVSDFSGFEVENPASEAPANVITLAGFTSILFTFDLPTDVDFVGVDFYILEGESGDVYADGTVTRVSGNTFNPDGLKSNTVYQIGAISVDQFGIGGSIDQFGIQTSAVVADTIGPITEPITIDESGGRLITNNSGYLGIMGVTVLPDVPNPIIFAAHDAIIENTIFYIDVDGGMKINMLAASSAIAVGSAIFGNSGCQITYDEISDRTQFYLGNGSDKAISFDTDTGDVNISEETTLIGVDGFNNNRHQYFHFYGAQSFDLWGDLFRVSKTLNPQYTDIVPDAGQVGYGRISLFGLNTVTDNNNSFAWRQSFQARIPGTLASTNDFVAVGIGGNNTFMKNDDAVFFEFYPDTSNLNFILVRAGVSQQGTVTYGTPFSVTDDLNDIITAEVSKAGPADDINFYITVNGTTTLIHTEPALTFSGLSWVNQSMVQFENLDSRITSLRLYETRFKMVSKDI